jgi:hypothetical protein
LVGTFAQPESYSTYCPWKIYSQIVLIKRKSHEDSFLNILTLIYFKECMSMWHLKMSATNGSEAAANTA